MAGNPQSAIRKKFTRRGGQSAISRSALTLIELLVVIIILTTLVAAAIPLMSPSNDDRRIRETARNINTFFTSAQSRAIELGRPYGVALKKFGEVSGKEDDNGVCLELHYVEQPPAYTGFDQSSMARVALHVQNPPDLVYSWYGESDMVVIQFVTRGTNVDPNQDGLPAGFDADLFPEGMIRVGDVIEIQGTRYQLGSSNRDQFVRPSVDANGFYRGNTGRRGRGPVQIAARPLNNTGQMLHTQHDDEGKKLSDWAPRFWRMPFFWTAPAPYKIIRQPMPGSDPPYQLPDGVAIDLRASGNENGSFYDPDAGANEVNNSDPVVIMFSPAGAIERVRFNQSPGTNEVYDSAITSTLYLLVGRRENIPSPAANQTADKTLDPSALSSAAEQVLATLREPINWLRGESRWIAIGAQSGRIVTVENALVDLTQLAYDPAYTAAASSNDVQSQRAQQINAARRFAREMTQTGGR